MSAEIEITIDPEFRDLLPAHSPEEAKAFREAVERDGKFTDNLIVWREKGKLLLLDGHRRFDLWCSLPDDTIIEPPNVDEISLPDRHAAKLWMLRRQLGRRNLTETQAAIFRGRLYNERKADPAGNLKVGTAKPAPEKSPKCHSDTSGKQGINGTSVAEEVAAETNSSVSTVKRDGAFSEALDAIGKVSPKAKADIESESMSLPKKDVIAIGKLGRDGIAAALKNVRNGKRWDAPKDDKRTSFDVAEIEGVKPAIDPNKETIAAINKAVGSVSRALLRASEIHGKGKHYKAIFDSIATIKAACAAWGGK